MKKIIIPFLLLTSATASANLADLNYQVKSGEVHYNTEYSYENNKAELSIAGTQVLKADIIQHVWMNTLSYGLSDKLSIIAGLNYRLVGDITSKPSSSDNTTDKSPGLMDPTVNFSYRLIDKSPVVIDLNAGADLGFQDAEGDAKRGGPVLNFGADTSQKFGNMELFSKMEFRYLFDSTEKDSDGSKSETESSLDILLNIMAQHSITKSAFLNYGIDFIYTGKTDSRYYDSAGVADDKFETENYLSYDFKLGGKYVVNNSLVLNCNVNYLFKSSYKAKSGSTDLEYDKYQGHGINLGLDYLF